MVGKVIGVNGGVIKIKPTTQDIIMGEMVEIGELRLTGEIIRILADYLVAQVFEDTTGTKVGDFVYGSKAPLSISLMPGLIGNIFDGIGRPLAQIKEKHGVFIKPGAEQYSSKKYYVEILAKLGDVCDCGDIIALASETKVIKNKVMTSATGEIVFIAEEGMYAPTDIIAKIKNEDGVIGVTMSQNWSIRQLRPVKNKIPPKAPMITGQRVVDTFFPIAKGGTAAIPGGFGTGKTNLMHQLAKWSDADIIVYVGCGERGNEITQVLEDFQVIVDPKTGSSIMERTVLIANTSNMPVSSREASIYTGITIAEYYRDMGYLVAIMADSTSRYAEALRELSGRLEEMPAEEGFPAYLSSRLAAFYERAGYVENLNGTEGSITIIGAVSPQGGDFSEPVTSQTKRFVKSFWALDRELAYSRHFPAINWLTSYSEYLEDLTPYFNSQVGKNFMINRNKAMSLLVEESNIMEIVKLIGSDILAEREKNILEISKLLRNTFLQQNAYHKFDTYVNLTKQAKMLQAIMDVYEKTKELIKQGTPMSVIKKSDIFEKTIINKEV